VARWAADELGVLVLPSGRTVRGGSASRLAVPVADYTLLLSTLRPRRLDVRTSWVRWPDFGVPWNESATTAALLDAWSRSEHHRVDVRCRGGRGRTGTALACLAVIDGLDPEAALELVRRRYDPRAVETLGQTAVVRRMHERQSAGSRTGEG
jgi:protein-tyrosine phosphatase